MFTVTRSNFILGEDLFGGTISWSRAVYNLLMIPNVYMFGRLNVEAERQSPAAL